jgi:hypothetical protein
VSTELTREALGGRRRGRRNLRCARYLPVRPRHAVVAARIAAATSWETIPCAASSAHRSDPARWCFSSTPTPWVCFEVSRR